MPHKKSYEVSDRKREAPHNMI